MLQIFGNIINPGNNLVRNNIAGFSDIFRTNVDLHYFFYANR